MNSTLYMDYTLCRIFQEKQENNKFIKFTFDVE